MSPNRLFFQPPKPCHAIGTGIGTLMPTMPICTRLANSRAAIDAQRGAFPLRLVFSVASGAYVVADHVDVSGANGRVLGVDNAGPMLLVKVPPGDYTVDASYAGKTERRRVHVGRDAATVNWRWSEEAKR